MSANWLHGLHHHADQSDEPRAMPVFEGQKLVVVGGSSGMGSQTAADVAARDLANTITFLAKDRQLTLLTATRQPEISEVAVLATLLQNQHGTGSLSGQR